MTHTVHDVHAGVDKVVAHTDPQKRAEATFDLILQQITQGIEEAKKKGTVVEAVKVFEDNAAEYASHREAIVAKLAK